MLTREFNACIVRPGDVTPLDESLEVVGTFNPGAAAVGKEVVLLVRVAERPRERRKGFTGLPRWQPGEGLTIDWVSNDELHVVDPRVVEVKATGVMRLTCISHLLVLRSVDGRAVDSFDGVRILPNEDYETYGLEDPRITRIGGRFYFSYVAVSPSGAATALASTGDFKSFERHGIIFPPDNKDVVFFPERIEDDHMAFHRPNPAMPFAPPAMWTACSPDLIHWGHHGVLYGGSAAWEVGRIGAGAPPLRTDEGWLAIYHGNDKLPLGAGVGRYVAAALLLDLENPRRVIRRSAEPIMVPETDFESDGFVPQVVFPSGIVRHDQTLQVFYGAADTNAGVVEFSQRELLDMLR